MITTALAAAACGGTNPDAPSATATVTAWVTGVVTDAESGRPLVGVQVDWGHPTDTWAGRHGVLTDETGQYRLQIEAPDRQRIAVRATGDDYVFQLRYITIVGDGTATVNFAMEPSRGRLITGMVTDAATGLPLKGARIEWAGLAEAWGDRGHGVVTDASGAYTLSVGPLGGPGTAEGRFWMRVSTDGYTEQVIQTSLNDRTVNFALKAVQPDIHIR